jgi:hypothetical protein
MGNPRAGDLEWACGYWHGGIKDSYTISTGKYPLRVPRRRWIVNIKTYLVEIGFEELWWIEMAQNRGLWSERGLAFMFCCFDVRWFDVVVGLGTYLSKLVMQWAGYVARTGEVRNTAS